MSNVHCFLILCTLFIALSTSKAYPNGSTYDQRQSGDYNIHISLKDIKIIALLNGGLGGSGDYDYNYDYSEMTIRPSILNQMINSTSTTVASSLNNVTESNSNAMMTTTEKVVEITPPPLVLTPKPPLEASIVKKPANLTTNQTAADNKPIKTKPTPQQSIPVEIILTPVQVQSLIQSSTKPQTTPSSTVASNATKTQQADCIDGFVKDHEGNCRPKIKKIPQQTLLRKLIQLSQRTHHPRN